MTQHDVAAALLALDPWGLSGALLRAPRPDLAERFVARVAELLPEGTPMRRLPASIPDDRLLGGLDLAMTLALGRPVAERGLLATLDGGVLVVPSAERLGAALVARLTQMIDTGSVPDRAPGSSGRSAAQVSILAVDESESDDAPVHEALVDRLAFVLALSADGWDSLYERQDIAAARALLPSVTIADDDIALLVRTAAAYGVHSLRTVRAAIRAARGAAALDGRTRASADDITLAAALTIGPRATQLPAPPPEEQAAEEPPPSESTENSNPPDEHADEQEVRELEERLIEAMAATLPLGLSIEAPAQASRAAGRAGRAGTDRSGGLRGRQVGTRRGDPRGGGRLDLVETLRAAAPWQPLRRQSSNASADGPPSVRVLVRPDDFRIRKLFEPAGTTAIFVVDASGSAAVSRMAEAKGAVELLLAESYARRDEVALVGFRGSAAEILLPPTRAIAAAKRALAALPGGGGTPLASAIDRAVELLLRARREGNDTVVVFLTDARANVARDGSGGRPQAMADALQSAAVLRRLEGTTLLIDTAARPSEQAQQLAAAMGARYVALPRTDARSIHAAVTAATATRP